MNRIRKTDVRILKAELNQPFRTALGTHEYLENVLFVVELEDKTKGYGEAAVATHITGETLEKTLKNLEYARKILLAEPIDQYVRISERLHRDLGGNPCAIAGIETALLDAYTRHVRVPLWRHFGKTCRKLQSDITVVIADLKETEGRVKKFYAKGFRVFKVKTGRDLDRDIKRLLAVKRLAPKSKVYVDANQGYSVGETLKFLDELNKNKVKIDLLEQPVAKDDWEGLKRIARASKVPVCADESVRTLEDAKKAIKIKLCPVINIKTMKSGLIQAEQIARLAKRHRVQLMIGGMMETSLAMTASAHLAAGLGCFDYVDLDTPFFIKGGLKGNPYLSADGKYDLGKVKSGVGFVPKGL